MPKATSSHARLNAEVLDSLMSDWDGPPNDAYFDERERRDAKAGADGAPVDDDLSGGRVPPADEPDSRAADVRSRLGVRPLTDISHAPPPPMLLGRCDPESHTVLFGPGDIGKGTLTAQWVVRLVRLGHTVLILDYENHPGEWGRRIHTLGGADVAAHVVYVAPTSESWHGKHGPIWNQVGDLTEVVGVLGITFVVIDSIVMACGGENEKEAASAAMYAGAVSGLGCPALSLAHTTKAEGLLHPFGSVFWHNLARVTWSLTKSKGRLLLACRKANNYAKPSRQEVTMRWRGGLPVEVSERAYRATIRDLVLEVLDDGPLAHADICDRVTEALPDDVRPVNPDTVSKELQRLKKDGLVGFEAGKWFKT